MKEERMESRKSLGNLAQTLETLLGLKPNLTPNWVKSVCEIVKVSSTHKQDQEFLDSISRTKDELAALIAHFKELNIQRKAVLNDFLDLKGNIRVFFRVRPAIVGENFGRLRPVTVAGSSNIVLKLDENKSKSYSFDRVFPPGSSQDEVFLEIEPVIKSVLDGYNACIFAYGQTGTGKTFTMEGRPHDLGVVPRTFKSLFQQAVDSNHSFLISFSMLEMYMGNLKDLLVPKPTRPTDPMPPCLSVQTDPDGGVEIENLVSIQVNDFHQALRLYRLGCRFRSTGLTNSNTTSSRSHCMIRIAITSFDVPGRRRDTNKIWLVDLGGSERLLKTKASGKRFDEGKAINPSLSALGDVINALQRKKHHIPYRNSKLTQVLKDSLGDDSKTLMLVHVSPKEEDLCETICSLNFATRAKNIHLGNDDTIEVREQKEKAMANLQEKMTEMENKQLHVKREIEILENKLENLTGKNLHSEEQAEAYDFTEEPVRNRVGDTTGASKSKLPSFMRPTICSKRKSGTVYQYSEWRVPVPGRRRRPSSHGAESITLPVKDHSDYKSEHSVSRSSCLATLNMRNDADNATEYSQDTSDLDVKAIALQEQKKKTNYIKKNVDRQTEKTDRIKFSKVDHWFDRQKNVTNVSGYTHRSKRILAIPTTKKKHTQEKHNNKKGKPVTDGGLTRQASEVAVNKPLPTLQDLFNSDLRSDSSEANEGMGMVQAQESIADSLTEDDEWSTFSPKAASCHRYCENDVDDEANAPLIMQAEYLQLSNHGCGEFLQPDLDGRSTCSEEVSSSSISMLELDLCFQKDSMESVMEDAERRESDLLTQTSVEERRYDKLQLRSQRSLFTNYSNLKDSAKQFDELQEEKQATVNSFMIKPNID